MNLKVCDRCGKQFRSYVAGGGNLVPIAPHPATEPKTEPPASLTMMSQLIVPVTHVNELPKKKDTIYSLAEVDACVECTVALAPLVQQWLKGKP